ncbi:MAG TPA: hypothetical protein VG826_18385 [Pirellulales bacterium]|nr:hypothetical protein [Pirellulales bacterium]
MDRITLYDFERLTGGRWLNFDPARRAATPLPRIVIDGREVAQGDVAGIGNGAVHFGTGKGRRSRPIKRKEFSQPNH